MITNLDQYTEVKNHTFDNGRTVTIYSKNTKKGLRYFYASRTQMRMFPISKKEIGIL